MDVLAPDVVSVADGGGLVRGAARRPIVGAEKLARYLVGGLAKLRCSRSWLDRSGSTAQPGIRVEVDGMLVGAVSVTIEDGRITRIYSVANPEKLEWLDEQAALSR